MTIDEVVDRAMAFIEKDQFSEKWIYTSKLFYKNIKNISPRRKDN